MHEVIESARREADRLRRVLKKGKNRQVQAQDETTLAKATAHAWFNNHRPPLVATLGDGATEELDAYYKELLAAANRSTSRRKYDDTIKNIRAALADLESIAIDPGQSVSPPITTSEVAPDFGPLVTDPKMRDILVGRWRECSICVNAGASLAAVVMMGGLLEALLLARIQREADKRHVLSARAAPKDRQTGKATPLNTWTLKDYIDVAHELGWISQTARDVGVVLRDYRNYVHPQKELSHGIVLSQSDARVLWEIAKSIARHAITGTATGSV